MVLDSAAVKIRREDVTIVDCETPRDSRQIHTLEANADTCPRLDLSLNEPANAQNDRVDSGWIFKVQMMTRRFNDLDGGLIFFKSLGMQCLDASAAPIDWHPVAVAVGKRHGRAAWWCREAAAIKETLKSL